MPPLTRTDKAIYYAVWFLSMIAAVCATTGLEMFHYRIAFCNSNVIAFDAGIGAVFPFLICLGGVCTLLVIWYRLKRPIFGDKTMRYGGYPWKIYMYPMFGPLRNAVDGRPTRKRLHTALTFVIVSALALTFLLSFRDVYRRACLMDDLRIVEYDSFNRPGEQISVKRDCDHLTIKTGVYPSRGFDVIYLYGIEISCKDGSTYSFFDNDFDLNESGHTDCLRQMLRIKSLFSSDEVIVEKQDLLPKVIADNHLDEEQTAMLQELFEK